MNIILSPRELADLELILDGSFCPLAGFMTQEEYDSVLEDMSLPGGALFSLPICLTISEAMAKQIFDEEIKEVILKDQNKFPIASLTVQSIFKPNIEKECLQAYGTLDDNHPYVKIVKGYADKYYIGGKVSLIQKPQHHSFVGYRRSPAEIKELIKQKGWQTVVGFQTRNILHRAHFELTKRALKLSGDPNAKLLLQPVVGPTQETDTDFKTRVRCYKALLPYYEPDSVEITFLNLSMRMAGPREAVLHAIIRQNYGCTHFIVGRDHAGPSTRTQDGKQFYEPDGATKLLEKMKDRLTIKILCSSGLSYVKELDQYLPEDEIPSGCETATISGTQLRDMIAKGKEIPSWFTFKEVQEEIKITNKPKHMQGFAIYCVGLPSAGKSTLANALKEFLEAHYPDRSCTLLDADEIRALFNKGLGFSKEDRSLNVRRIGYMTSLIVRSGGIALVANIAPYAEDRKENRKLIENYGGYCEVYVGTTLEECKKRDAKGLYKAAIEGKIQNMTGIDDPFEAPEKPEVALNGTEKTNTQIEIVEEKLLHMEYLSKSSKRM